MSTDCYLGIVHIYEKSLESVIQSEVSQKEKSKCRIITHICGI